MSIVLPGTRLEVTDVYVGKMEQDIRDVVSPHDMNMIVSNIGITPDLSRHLYQQFRNARFTFR